MATHTPGPWKQGSSWYLIDGSNELGVAGVDVGNRNAQANARLIAAAPAMLAALEAIDKETASLKGLRSVVRVIVHKAIAQARNQS